MDNPKNDQYYVDKIVSDIEFIISHMTDVDLPALESNEVLLDSMLFRMIQISENAKKISSDYKQQKPLIPWTSISGLRNKIVHDYGNVDLDIVYETIKYDIPDLLEKLR